MARGFQNGMTTAIGPKNEASKLKSLKLAKIKDFTNDVFLEYRNWLISVRSYI